MAARGWGVGQLDVYSPYDCMCFAYLCGGDRSGFCEDVAFWEDWAAYYPARGKTKNAVT